MSEDRVVLPKNVVPSHYDLTLEPDLVACKFRGKVVVTVTAAEATARVVLHANEIEIQSAKWVAEDGATLETTSVEYEKEHERASIVFSKDLPLGKATLQLDFTGILNDQMVGFYQSKYKKDGEERIMASTQFEATDARRAFPCWDEPAVKATFDVTIIHAADRVAISNMPVRSQTTRESDGYTIVSFESTPKMSTYLLAFVVGEFDYVEGATKEGVSMRVYTPLGAKEQGLFALDVGTRVLSYFTEYFGIGYPLPKADMITIPNFSAGAMENWGLITYREAALLIDEKNSSIASKQNVAYTVAHELAHQWFGNLVTMEWWTHLWLNEGFATWVGNLAVAHLFPEWDIWTQFVTDYYNQALELDELLSSHPIEVPVKNSAEIDEIFDTISYCKGASVIRMIVDWLGEENFRKGINLYLNRFLYGNAETDDLWAALEEASGKSVKEFMGNWTRTVGFPVVSIEQGEGDELKIKQERFLTTAPTEPVEDQKWWLGLSFTDSSNESKKFDFTTKEGTVAYGGFCGCSWIKCNAGQNGFYRTNYAPELLSKLKEPVLNLAISPVDRLGIQNDVFALSKAGQIATSQALEFAEAYTNEVEYPVWSDLIGSVGYLSGLWSEEPNHLQFQKYIVSLLSGIHQKLGWTPKEGESPLTPMLRSLVIATLGGNGDKQVVETALARFQEFLKDPATLPADLKGVVYRMSVEYGGEQEYEQVLQIYRSATLPEERLRALRALGFARTPALLRRSLEFSLSDEVRTQDTYIVIAAASSSAQTRKSTWEFMQENWATFESKFGSGQFLFGCMISYATSKFTTEEAAEQIEQYFAKNPVPQAERTIKQSLESIRSNARWLSRERAAVAAFLTNVGMDSRREALRRAVVSMMFPGESEPSFYEPPTKEAIEALAQAHKEVGHREEQASLAFPKVRLVLPLKCESGLHSTEPRAAAMCERESGSDSSHSSQDAEKGLTKNQKRKLRKKKQKRAKVATQGNIKAVQVAHEFCHVNPPDVTQPPVNRQELSSIVSDFRANDKGYLLLNSYVKPKSGSSDLPCKTGLKRAEPLKAGFVEFFQFVLSLLATKDDESCHITSQIDDGIQYLIDCQAVGSLPDELSEGLGAIKQFMESREHQLAEEQYFKLYIGQTSSKGGSHDPLQNQSTHKMLQSIKRLITFWKIHTTQHPTN